MEGLKALAKKSFDSTFNVVCSKDESDRMGEILEQESLELDTPMEQPRIRDVKKELGLEK